MFKNLITPIQMWLLAQGRCVGCGNPISKGKVAQVRGKTTVSCKCGRVFIHDKTTNTFRRALFDEI